MSVSPRSGFIVIDFPQRNLHLDTTHPLKAELQNKPRVRITLEAASGCPSRIRWLRVESENRESFPNGSYVSIDV